QSAKDYFTTGNGSSIFFLSQGDEHYGITLRCLNLMSDTLKKDICDLKEPGALIEGITRNQDALAGIRYACCYWVDHLVQTQNIQQVDLLEKAYKFLQKHFLYWLEALSLIGSISQGAIMLRSLESLTVSDTLRS